MLKKDLPITPQSILDLSSVEGIIKFFTDYLKYNTHVSTPGTPEVEKAFKEKLHTHEELRRKITTFRRIALNSDATATLHVYLYVVTSLTSKATAVGRRIEPDKERERSAKRISLKASSLRISLEPL